MLTLVCGHATIEPDEDSAGHGFIVDPWVTFSAWDRRGIYHRSIDSALRARIIAYMAGRAAEEECLGVCPGGDGDDCRQIDLMLDSLLSRNADLPGLRGAASLENARACAAPSTGNRACGGRATVGGKLTSRQIERAIKGVRRR